MLFPKGEMEQTIPLPATGRNTDLRVRSSLHYSHAAYGNAKEIDNCINESVYLIDFLFKVKAYEKFYHRHIADIPRIKFFV